MSTETQNEVDVLLDSESMRALNDLVASMPIADVIETFEILKQTLEARAKECQANIDELKRRARDAI